MMSKEVPVTRATVEQAIETIALSCARGVRQHEAMVKLIETGKITSSHVRIGAQRYITIGGMQWSSWTGLKRRLRAAGFIIKINKLPRSDEVFYTLFWTTNWTETSA